MLGLIFIAFVVFAIIGALSGDNSSNSSNSSSSSNNTNNQMPKTISLHDIKKTKTSQQKADEIEEIIGTDPRFEKIFHKKFMKVENSIFTIILDGTMFSFDTTRNCIHIMVETAGRYDRESPKAISMNRRIASMYNDILAKMKTYYPERKMDFKCLTDEAANIIAVGPIEPDYLTEKGTYNKYYVHNLIDIIDDMFFIFDETNLALHIQFKNISN